MGYVTEFIKHISKRSQIVAHQLIWNMQTNMYMDEDQQHRDRNEFKFKLFYNFQVLVFFLFSQLISLIFWNHFVKI